jgi:hypothetical protein
VGKAADSRANGFIARHGELVQVELEALDPSDLRGLYEGALWGFSDVVHGRHLALGRDLLGVCDSRGDSRERLGVQFGRRPRPCWSRWIVERLAFGDVSEMERDGHATRGVAWLSIE